MGEEGVDDPQRIKRIAAAAYDYENDPRWADYWANVLIPPHMAARSDVVDHFKRKFYQRYIVLPRIFIVFLILEFWEHVVSILSKETIQVLLIKDPDLVVEAMTSTSSSQSSRPSASARSATPASSEQARPRNSGSSNGTSSAPGSNANSVRRDPQTIQFAINSWVIIVAGLSVFPLVPRNLANKANRLSLLGTACSSLYSLYTLYGRPRAWNMPAVQSWLQSVIGTKDFIYFIYCLTFVSSQAPFKFSLIPVVCRSSDYVAKFLRHNFQFSSLYREESAIESVQQRVTRIYVSKQTRKYLEDACLWVEANTTTLSILSSNAEIALGFLLILSLFSWQRSILQTFMYWQLLKLMYHAPATAGYHRSVWSRIGRTVYPYIYRYAPFLASPISAVQRWWLR